MRFDDSLQTVLSAETTSSLGAGTTWRQLVDLIGRGRAGASGPAIQRLRSVRGDVPPPVRAASARALALATPPAALVALFAEDDIAVASPVLRSVTLDADEWIELLPAMSPAARSILRHRRDLPAAVGRALEHFGSVDFVLAAPAAEPAVPDGSDVAVAAAAPQAVAPDAPATANAPVAEPLQTVPPGSSFVSIAAVAAGLPVVAEALRRADQVTAPRPVEAVPMPAGPDATGPFPIAELVARIDAYTRRREATPSTELQPELFAIEPVPARSFRFETDAGGVVRWVEGVARAALIGLSLDLAATSAGARVDGIAAGAFRRRARFDDARLVVDGQSDAAGQWRISGVPVFDRASGRFTGYRGTARRPRPDEAAEPARAARDPAADALRQLVHELRTPTNAIAGFAEMIEQQMLGPVPAAYRAQAAAIRAQTHGLICAIDDIDMAARIETRALDLAPGVVPVAPLFARIAGDLAPLAALHGAELSHAVESASLAILGDDRAVERLVGRIAATLVAATGNGERIGVAATFEDGAVVIAFDRPAALADYGTEALLTIDPEDEVAPADVWGGAPLLGTGFALRLARNLASELRGSLTIDARRLTLRLPAAEAAPMEQVSSS